MPFCPHCGSLIMPSKSRCSNCGRGIGDPVVKEAAAPPKKAAVQPNIVEKECDSMPFFPYAPRPVQSEIYNDILDAMDGGNHIVIESGTGTGKTIVSLAPALNHALRNGKKVIYLTRTITQSDQVMRELRAISKLRPVSGVTVTGRGRSCPLLRNTSKGEPLPPMVLKNICEDEKKKVDAGRNGCIYYYNLASRIDGIIDHCLREHPTSEELDRYCESLNVCPYEAKKIVLKEVDVIVAPYIHILSEDIRDNFLGNIERDATNVCMIVDEAHNVIDAAREQESYSIPMSQITAAVDELSTMKGDPPILENLSLGTFVREFRNIVRTMAGEMLTFTKKEAILPNDEIQSRLCKRFSINSGELSTAIMRMNDLGSERTEMLIDRGEDKVSDIQTLAEELDSFISTKGERYIKSIKATDDGEVLHAACIDPFEVTQFIRNVNSTVHMSGTLQPIDQYVRVMALPGNTVQKIYPSPFPKENRSVVYVKDVSTRYEDMKRDPTMSTRIRRYVIRLCNSIHKNTLVFFPSYRLMNEMRPFFERDIKKDLYWEESRSPRKTADNLLRFRNGRDGVFFTVMGGSIAEGIDFPGEELCFSILVGIPYPPPTLENKAMSDMFDKRYGQSTGWRYTSEVPALRKMQQAFGRMIRTETDRGMAVILDSRASKYASKLDAVPTDDPVGDAVRFFEVG